MEYVGPSLGAKVGILIYRFRHLVLTGTCNKHGYNLSKISYQINMFIYQFSSVGLFLAGKLQW